MAFNAKNLTYDKSEPAFLQRLKAGYASQDGRNNVQHARPGKSRLKMGDGDEDDGPVILDESGEVVRKEVYEGMMNGKKVGSDDDDDDTNDVGEAGKDGKVVKERTEAETKGDAEGAESERTEAQKVAEIGAASKKRKAVKVVGANDDDVEEVAAKKTENEGAVKPKGKEAAPVTAASEKPKKKKAKKIKLSFDEPE